jgi:hypothetical protein
LIGFMIWGKCKRSDLVYGINREIGAAGDLSMYYHLRKIKKDAFIIDDLNEPRLYVYQNNPAKKVEDH